MILKCRPHRRTILSFVVIAAGLVSMPIAVAGDGDEKGDGSGKNADKGNCGKALEYVEGNASVWKKNNEDLSQQWPGGLTLDVIEKKQGFELSDFAKAHPEIVMLTFVACNDQSVTFSRNDMLNGRRHFLLLNSRNMWKLTVQNGGRHTKVILMNLKKLIVTKSDE